MSTLIGLFTLIVLVPSVLLWESFVFCKLWAWFMVPLFKMPLLSVLQSAGVVLVMSCTNLQGITPHDVVKLIKGDTKETQIQLNKVAIMNGIIRPAIFLLVGWIVAMFI